jgi:hypothetical protein
MQVVGRRCVGCEARIVSVSEALICGACETVLHRECAEQKSYRTPSAALRAAGTPLCSTCTRPLRDAERGERSRLQHPDIDGGCGHRQREGKSWLATIIACQLGISTVLIATQGVTTVRLISLTLTVALFWSIWRGSRWAREILGCLFGLAAALSMVLGVFHGEVARSATLRFILLAYAAYGFSCCWALLRSRDVRAFVDHQLARRSRGMTASRP